MTALSDDDFMLAAEYVLSLLSAAEQTDAEARMAADPDFAAEVEAWRVRLLPLIDGEDVKPPEHVWDAVIARIPAASPQNGANSPTRIWQMLTALSATAAAVLAVILWQQPKPVEPVAPSSPMIASMSGETGRGAVTASYNVDKGELLLMPVSLDTGDLYPELWIIPADGQPRSLGMMDDDAPSMMTVDADMRQYLADGATLAITPEPKTGGPGGKPTGPVIASGKITTI